LARGPFDSFVVLAGMRTGSNFLEANLNALPGVVCWGEVFNPVFIGRKDQTEMFGIDMAAREADPAELLRRLRAQTPGLAGFRYFHDHDPRILPLLLEDPRCAKIVLTRNPAESWVSLKIAQATGQWKLTNAKNLRAAPPVRFDAAEFERHLRTQQEFQLTILRGLQVSGQTAFYIDYDDLQEVEVLNGLAAFLGVEARLEAPDPTLKKQNPEEIGAKVANLEEMEAALARLDRFNLARTPNFEPRRAPGIPGWVAAMGAPLLFLPVKAGPEGAVRAWLGAIGRGGVRGDFVQKTLRLWKKATPGHRSFTVVRHPLLRAHVAFREGIVSGRLAEHRQLLARVHKVDLPPPGRPFDDAEGERTAFLAYLAHAKKAVAGQTGLRIDPAMATQAAVLQGFAGWQAPDAVLREDRLALGLAWLAAEVGVPAPAWAPEAEPAAALARIWDPALEDAAADAYGRDMIAFGFGRWRG
jgi:LPS sulfotransferase NodH